MEALNNHLWWVNVRWTDWLKEPAVPRRPTEEQALKNIIEQSKDIVNGTNYYGSIPLGQTPK